MAVIKKRQGRPIGSTKGRVKVGATISRENAAYLDKKKAEGYEKSRILDIAINLYREADK